MPGRSRRKQPPGCWKRRWSRWSPLSVPLTAEAHWGKNWLEAKRIRSSIWNEKKLHVRIVPMTADHLDEVAELERICFTTPWSRNMLAEELDNYLSAFLVALDDQDTCGGLRRVCRSVLDEGYITNVAVRPDCRKQGVAGKLLQVFLDFAQGNHLAFL